MSDGFIFNISRTDHKYKGILFAEADNEAVDREMNAPFPTPKSYVAGIMGLIWVDEKEIWHAKFRIKFPSGNKQVVSLDFDEEHKKKVKMNTTYVLQKIYKMPMINKKWYPNPTEDIDGIIKIMKESDMIEFSEYKKVEKEEVK